MQVRASSRPARVRAVLRGTRVGEWDIQTNQAGQTLAWPLMALKSA